MRYFKLANGCSTVDPRSRITSGVARCCMRCKRLFMQVTGNVAAWAYGASRFEWAGSADFWLGCIEHGTILSD